jgi:chemotaxis protein MotB
LFSYTLKWMAVGSVLALVLPACVAQAKHVQTLDDLAKTQEERDAAAAQLQDAEMVIADASAENEALARKANDLAAEKAKLEALLNQLKTDGKIPQIANTTLFISGDTYGYRAEGDVIFTAGSDTITTEGKKILGNVATELKKNQHPIVVVGHTDSDPIQRTADKWPRGNMQLGAGRALSVCEFLVGQGIPESRIAIESFGPYQPLASGTGSDAKKKNRRVEIMVKVTDNGPAAPTPTASGSH